MIKRCVHLRRILLVRRGWGLRCVFLGRIGGGVGRTFSVWSVFYLALFGFRGEKGESCPEGIEYVRFIERYIRGGGRGGELMYMRMAVGGR